MDKQKGAQFISMLSTPIKHSKLIMGRRVFCFSANQPIVISIASGVFKIKSISSGKTVKFLISGDYLYVSNAFRMHYHIEEIKQGDILHVHLRTLLEYSGAKNLLTPIIECLLEGNPLDISILSLDRSSAKKEVINLSMVYKKLPEELKDNISINSFIENTSFLSRGTISKKLRMAHLQNNSDCE